MLGKMTLSKMFQETYVNSFDIVLMSYFYLELKFTTTARCQHIRKSDETQI